MVTTQSLTTLYKIIKLASSEIPTGNALLIPTVE